MTSAQITALQIKKVQNRQLSRLIWLAAGLAIFLGVSLFIGRYPGVGFISWQQVAGDELAQRLMLNLRLPRIIMALFLGMSLAAAGMVFQLLFNNPLVEPGFLGVSQGSGFGAALWIVLFGGNVWGIQFSAAAFAFAGLAFSYFLARRFRYGGWVLRLVLAGIAVSALFSAGLGMLKIMADPLSQLPEITFWLLGSLAGITWQRFLSILPFTLLGLVVLYLYRWRINVLALSEETAFSLGAAPGRERLILMISAVLPTAALISAAGMVGWVGLIVPHIARRLFGANTRFSLPGAMLLGGWFTLLCDNFARMLLAGEIPLGILTSAFGALMFLALFIFQKPRIQK